MSSLTPKTRSMNLSAKHCESKWSMLMAPPKPSKRLYKVTADRHKFGLQTIDVGRGVVHRREMAHSHVTDSDVIGREQDKGEIIRHLMQQNPMDDHKGLSVIPITGMVLCQAIDY
ncbi:hypothetical protein JHK82_053316 [Glycine max]|nr:hypothetical protein JHK82_053316 [Glycine max]KHN34682.1 hypothetical protein glysoja_011235 [Glycine soja]